MWTRLPPGGTDYFYLVGIKSWSHALHELEAFYSLSRMRSGPQLYQKEVIRSCLTFHSKDVRDHIFHRENCFHSGIDSYILKSLKLFHCIVNYAEYIYNSVREAVYVLLFYYRDKCIKDMIIIVPSSDTTKYLLHDSFVSFNKSLFENSFSKAAQLDPTIDVEVK